MMEIQKTLSQFENWERSGWSKSETPNSYVLKVVLDLLKAKADDRLVILPCRVGDVVYVLMKRNATTEVVKDTVSDIYRCNNGIWWVEFCDLWVDRTFGDFGKIVFLTHKEAEKALRNNEQ